MSSYARIVDNQAVQTITPPVGHTLAECLHPSLVGLYTEVPAGVVAGAVYDAETGTWTNPDATAVPAPEADAAAQRAAARTNKLAAINAAAGTALDALAAGYPDREVASWDQQVREAALVAADATRADAPAEGAEDAIPLLRAMATVRPSLSPDGTTADRIIELARRIRANAAAWSVAAGAIIGRRQALEDAVTEAETVEAVAAIVVDFGGAV